MVTTYSSKFCLLAAVVYTFVLADCTHVEEERDRRLLEEDYVLDIQTLKQQVAALQAAQHKQGLFVAVNAYLIANLNPGPNQQIIFDNVSVNQGSAYNAVHGIFTAPYAGTYLFSVSSCSAPGHSIQLELMQNAVSVKDILAGDDAYADCASGTTLLELQAGGDVWVRHRGTIGDHIEAYPRAVSFTGALVHAS